MGVQLTTEKTVPSETGLASIIGNFGPTYDNKTVFYDYQKRSKEGNFAKLPILIGANKNESSLFNFLSTVTGSGPLNQSQSDGIENGFNCPNDLIAQNRRNFGINAWRYYYMAEYQNVIAVPGQDFGTFHGAEVQQIFNTTDVVSTVAEYAFLYTCFMILR